MNEFLYSILAWINSWVGNWGWSMVVFTIMIRLVLTPLDVKSRVSMRKTQKLQPQMQALQKKYANDKEKLNRKTQELYKTAHVNPLSSCLPLLLTWPVLIAVFAAMRSVANMELLKQFGQILNKQNPDLEQWLYIKNLWMADSLFAAKMPDMNALKAIPADQWQKWFADMQELPVMLQELGLKAENFADAQSINTSLQTIFGANGTGGPIFELEFYSAAMQKGFELNLLLARPTFMVDYNGLLILPIMSALSQVAMTKLTGNGQQPGNDQAAGSTGKIMTYFFPLFSLWICLSYSAAFSLYWVAGNLVAMVQTLVINKFLDAKEQKAAPAAGEGSVK